MTGTGGRPVPTQHGTTGYYQYHGCKCDPCKDAMGRYRKRLDFEHASGLSRRVPVAPIREHTQRLIDAGATPTSIAKYSGGAVTHVQVTRILDGSTSAYLFPKCAQALLAIEPGEALAGFRMVNGIGCKRRVNALHALGFTKDDIGAAVGFTGYYVQDLCAHDQIQARSLDVIKRAYEILSSGSGTSDLQRWRAVREEWAPPMAWEDEDLDNPAAEPHWEWVRCVGSKCSNPVHKRGLCAYHYTKLRRRGTFEREKKYFRQDVLRHCSYTVGDTAGLLEDVGELKALGLTPENVAAQIGRGVTYVEKIWSRA
jgi:hypothetical protein